MKRIMLILLGTVLMMPAFAQYGTRRYPTRPATSGHFSQPRTYSDIYYGLRLGVAFATVNSDDKYLDGGSSKTGLDVGAVVGFQLGYHSPMYFETGLRYIEKGGKGKYEGAKFTYSLDYLELPLVLKYWYDIDNSFSVQPFLGGYLALGVGGKIKDFGQRQAYSSFDNEGFQRFDGGIKLGCGVQYDLIYAELGYDIGLANISHDYFDTSHTGSLFLAVGVNF
ncbi:MAG: PorT family protein [Prevotella sp.]|nr:PorT family protein [Prevotella sp.]